MHPCNIIVHRNKRRNYEKMISKSDFIEWVQTNHLRIIYEYYRIKANKGRILSFNEFATFANLMDVQKMFEIARLYFEDQLKVTYLHDNDGKLIKII